MSLLAVDNIFSGYGGMEILHGVTIKLDQGEIVTIIGPNGAGKSTLLKPLWDICPRLEVLSASRGRMSRI